MSGRLSERDFRIELECDDAARAFKPGGRLSARVKLHAPTEWRADYLDIVVFWRTEGLGDEDKGIIAKETPFDKAATVPASFEFPLAVDLPQMPWTYPGRTLKIRWFIGVFVDPKPGAEIGREFEVIVHPRPDLLDGEYRVGQGGYIDDDDDDDDDDIQVEESGAGPDAPPPMRAAPKPSIASSLNPPAPPTVAPPD